MAVEVPADKVVDLRFRCRVQILELVHRLEFDHVQAVWKNAVWLALQQVLALVCGDMRHGREDIGAVRGGTLNAVPVVDTALSRFVVDIEVLEIVVEVDRAGTEITAEQGSMSGKHRCDIDVPLAQERDGETSLPLVEVGDHGLVELACDILYGARQST